MEIEKEQNQEYSYMQQSSDGNTVEESESKKSSFDYSKFYNRDAKLAEAQIYINEASNVKKTVILHNGTR